MSCESHKKSVIETFISMGFQKNYIVRALKVYEKNYGLDYKIEVVTEILVRLRNKDKAKKVRRLEEKKKVQSSQQLQAILNTDEKKQNDDQSNDEIQIYDSKLYSVNNNIITKEKGGPGSIYGKTITTKTIHHWRVKILNFHQNYQLFIGIHYANKTLIKWPEKCKMRDAINYGYGSCGKRFSGNGKKTVNFGDKYYNDDIVNIVLDLKKGTVSFGLNDSNVIVAYKIGVSDMSLGGYCLGIHLSSKQDAVKLLSYNCNTNDYKNNISLINITGQKNALNDVDKLNSKVNEQELMNQVSELKSQHIQQTEMIIKLTNELNATKQ
eukprot:539960_1